jgi:RND family efflux transporter MFP subunit
MGSVAVVFLGTMAAGVTALNSRASAERSPDSFPPITVQAQQIEILDAYRVEERYVGLLEPARQTRLAFERPGLVTEILYDEGAEVVQGAVVAKLDTSKLMSERRGLEARLHELKARYELASVTLSRQKSLKAKGWQSAQKYDEARYNAAQLASAIQGVQASIDSLDVDIAKSELRAPYSGIVGGRMIDEGSVVAPGVPVIDLLESQVRRARVGVSVEAARGVEADRVHRLAVDGTVVDGFLVSKRPDLDTRSQTVTLIFEVIGGDGARFGDIVELVVERSVPARGAWLPMSALTEGPKGLWNVFTVVDEEGGLSVAREVVEVLHVDDRRVFVRGNLAGGGNIVVSGTNRIIPGQPVALPQTIAGL